MAHSSNLLKRAQFSLQFCYIFKVIWNTYELGKRFSPIFTLKVYSLSRIAFLHRKVVSSMKSQFHNKNTFAHAMFSSFCVKTAIFCQWNLIATMELRSCSMNLYIPSTNVCLFNEFFCLVVYDMCVGGTLHFLSHCCGIINAHVSYYSHV